MKDEWWLSERLNEVEDVIAEGERYERKHVRKVLGKKRKNYDPEARFTFEDLCTAFLDGFLAGQETLAHVILEDEIGQSMEMGFYEDLYKKSRRRFQKENR